MGKSIRLVSWMVAFILAGAAPSFAQTARDIQEHLSCKYCGMNRQQFAQSRILIEYDDGTSLGACSIHCAAVDLALHIDKTPVSIKVGSYLDESLIDAESATWVLGGNKPGVMSKRAKWAFAKREDAEIFVRDNGGELATFDQVMKASYEDMYEDTRMIREMRKARRHQQGQANNPRSQ